MIHKTKKGEGKKHITIPLRWEFRLFRPDSRPISAVSVVARYGPIWLDSGWISPVRRKSKERKKAQTWHQRVGNRVGRCVPCRAASDSGAAPSQSRPCFPDSDVLSLFNRVLFNEVLSLLLWVGSWNHHWMEPILHICPIPNPNSPPFPCEHFIGP